MSGVVFRLDGNTVVHIPGHPKDAGPGSLIVWNCPADVNFVANAIRQFVKSDAHINCTDQVQSVEWSSIQEAMQAGPGVAAIAKVH